MDAQHLTGVKRRIFTASSKGPFYCLYTPRHICEAIQFLKEIRKKYLKEQRFGFSENGRDINPKLSK